MPMPRSLMSATFAAFALLAGPAHAVVGFAVTPSLPATVTVGQSGLQGSFELQNLSTPPHGSMTICEPATNAPCSYGADMLQPTLTPSCGTYEVSATPCPVAEPGVFHISPYAVGALGTTCAGEPFMFAETAPGRFRLDATAGGNLVLPTSGSTCRVIFTMHVQKVPRADADGNSANGAQARSFAVATGIPDFERIPVMAYGGSTVTVQPGPPPPAAPQPPLPTDSDPRGPHNIAAPEIWGSAAVGATIRLYANGACSGFVLGEGTVDGSGAFAVAAHVAENSSTDIHATATVAGLTSACSTSFVRYVEDSTAPPAPVLTDTDPASPASADAPRVRGVAEAGSTVRIYGGETCTGTPLAIGSADAFASPGLQVPALPHNSTTSFSATAADKPGNTSTCGGPLVYVHAAPPPPPAAIPPPPVAALPPIAAPPPVAAPPPAPLVTSGPGCKARGASFVGTAAADKPRAVHGTNVMFGRGGDDDLSGLAAGDCLYGDAGADRLRGGGGDDRLFGGTGADRLGGGPGGDRLSGGPGSDRLVDGSGRDRFSGGAGDDLVDARDGSKPGRQVADAVGCGPGRRDVAYADRRDRVAGDCERVERR